MSLTLAEVLDAVGGRALTTARSPYSASTQHGLCLVVADRGHVWVGEVSEEDEWIHIEKGRVVRIWGTQRGLNQLANEGPLSSTKLDDPATVRVSRRAVIALIPCEASKWSR